jgi:hypothetical protein
MLYNIVISVIFCVTCRRAKYELQHLVRVNLAGQDRAYRCVYQLEDENGEDSNMHLEVVLDVFSFSSGKAGFRGTSE